MQAARLKGKDTRAVNSAVWILFILLRFLYAGPLVAQADCPVEYQFVIRRVRINHEVALSLELEPVSRFRAFQERLNVARWEHFE
jgi:hypothetical protein